MVGLYPIYDPKPREPVARTWATSARVCGCPACARTTPTGPSTSTTTSRWSSSTCRLDDGVTIHKDIHDALGQFPDAHNPRTHPEWWGKTFYKHFPSHGFVGDIFTVNGTAYPTLEVKRRKYRFRFLDASIARIYEFKLMASTQGPKSAASLGFEGDDLEGQYRIPDGQQCMRFTQIATDGGLLPFPLTRDSFELWPAKRREFIVDFTRYQDGSPDHQGRRHLPDQRHEDAQRADVDQLHPVRTRLEVQGAGPEDRDRRRRPGRQRDADTYDSAACPPAAAEQLAVHAGQPPDLRGQARQRRRGDRVADQRQTVRPPERAEKPEERGREHTIGHSPRRTASTCGRSATAAAAGYIRSTCTWRNTAR